ncbi:MAG: hypothetical protein ACE5LA_00155 [Dehalococcoidales bacterium]
MQLLFSKIKRVSESKGILSAFIGVLVFGSIWGLLEATLGGFLHLIHFPYKGAITAGIGMSIMATFVATYRQPKLVIGIGLVAALFKPLSALIYGRSIFDPFVINPASAILLEALALSLVVSLMFKGFESSIKMRIAVGVSAGYLGITLYAVFASVLGMGNWPFMAPMEKLISTFSNGTGLAIIGTGLLLLGHMVGTHLRLKLLQLRTIKPKIFYASAGASTVLCWIIAAFAFASGL